jgi:hypothetical protein
MADVHKNARRILEAARRTSEIKGVRWWGPAIATLHYCKGWILSEVNSNLTISQHKIHREAARIFLRGLLLPGIAGEFKEWLERCAPAGGSYDNESDCVAAEIVHYALKELEELGL